MPAESPRPTLPYSKPHRIPASRGPARWAPAPTRPPSTPRRETLMYCLRRAAGRVIEILGHPDDFGIDVEIVIRKHHLPHQFPPEVVEQAERVPGAITAWELEGRQDFRAFDIVTIDGETARDFDDAVWVDHLPNGNYALHVHIADVSHYVRPGTPIDAEARLRGTSVYFPDRAVP